MRGGLVNAGAGGGAIFNAGTLTVSGSSVRDSVSATEGGGIANRGGTLTLLGSSISHNRATGAGGGISNRDGSLTIEGSTVSDNQSAGGTDEARGGGIASHARTATASLTLTDSLVTRNTVDGLGGGGIDNAASAGRTATALLTRSTVSDNVALGTDHTEGLGGGLQNSFFRPASQATAQMTLVDSTVSGNQALDGGGISSGIDFVGNVLRLTLVRSTVSENRAAGDGFQSGNGGGLYSVNGETTLANSTVTANAALGTGNLSGLGGGIMSAGLNGPATLTVVASTISHNQAADSGGGLANTSFNGGATSTFLTGTLLAANEAPDGRNCTNQEGTLALAGAQPGRCRYLRPRSTERPDRQRPPARPPGVQRGPHANARAAAQQPRPGCWRCRRLCCAPR